MTVTSHALVRLAPTDAPFGLACLGAGGTVCGAPARFLEKVVLLKGGEHAFRVCTPCARKISEQYGLPMPEAP